MTSFVWTTKGRERRISAKGGSGAGILSKWSGRENEEGQGKGKEGDEVGEEEGMIGKWSS